MSDQYITLQDLSAKLAGRSDNSIRRDIKRGALPAPTKLGGIRYWNVSLVDAYMRNEPPQTPE